MKTKVLLGMSGGIDSSVSAMLLQRDGYEVVGVYMKLHDKEGYHEENYKRASQVGERLGVEVCFLDLSDSFRKDIYDYFVQSYQEGLTPNPCVMCNRLIKFGALIDFASSLRIEKVATGHYIRCDGEFFYKAIDETKDQTYFVAQVKKEVLPKLIFPLGEWRKEDLKIFASQFETFEAFKTQKESNEICFVEGEYTDILAKHFEIDKKGKTLTSDGKVVGEHKGYMHYTIGKRRGFSVHGAHDPHFVLSINPQNNEIIVGKKEELEVKNFRIKNINLFEEKKSFKAQIKVRYRTQGIDCTISLDGNGGEVFLDESVFGLAKGQFAVFYEGDKLIGSGEIW
ncbi:MAG: thiouridylase [Sulfurovum sp. AS07-7]|nr:MAG: thiouridylase [Sulfurovum sp. AS07-7]